MALTCWIAGWAAAARLAWEPLAVAAGIFALFAMAQALRGALRLRTLEPVTALRKTALAAGLGLLPLAVLALLAMRLGWVALLALPAVVYAPFLLFQSERRPIARVIAIAAFSAIAPATHALALGAFTRVSAILWAALASYYVVGGIFIMARLRHSTGALWAARLLALTAFGSALALHWLLAAAFAPLVARTWLFRCTSERPDPRRVGKAELAFSSLAASLVLLSIWMR
jgi:hypothetical protein